MRLHNTVDEFLLSQNIGDVKETVEELEKLYHIKKAICFGHILLNAFSKTSSEFQSIMKLLLEILGKSPESSTQSEEA